jgi:RNA polymerase sigma-70 factor (ECF subfamily)
MFFKKSHYSEDDLNSLLAACKDKNPKAQKTLIRIFFSYAKSISLRYATSREEMEEIIDDSFLKVFQNIEKYDYTTSFKAWFRTIVIHTTIDYYRKSLKYAHQVDIDEVDVIDLNDDVINKISAEEILSLVQQLPPSYRIVFTLYVVEGYNHREIAEMLGIKEGTSKSNLQDARRKLQHMIKTAFPHLYLAYSLKHSKINAN